MKKKNDNSRPQMVKFAQGDKLVMMPINELAPGCVKCCNAETGEIFYADAGDLEGFLPQRDFKHGPFDDDVRQMIKEIADTFALHYGKGDVEYWENEFRKDENPDREIAMWSFAADVFRRATEGKPPSLKDLAFSVVTARLNHDDNGLKHVLHPKVRNHPIAKEVLRMFKEGIEAED